MGPAPSTTRSILPPLWAFAFLSYLLRTNIAVAQQYMARDLHWNNTQIGYIFTAFLVGYTTFQVPAGVLGDRFGPRIVLFLSALGWAVTTVFTGLAPGLIVKTATLSLVAVLLIRFVHGIGEASTYPVAMIAVSEWFEPSRHAFINAIIFTGSTAGAALGPPLVASVMNGFGWRVTFYLTGALPLIPAMLWWSATRKRPRQKNVVERSRRASGSDWLPLLLERNVWMLSASYFLYCYAISIFVYWLFKYLVDVRGLSIAGSGWATSLPWIVASIAVPLLGLLTVRVSRRAGLLRGRRLISTACLVVSAGLMFIGAGAPSIGIALGAIALSVGLLFSTEASYWSTAIDISSGASGSASGIMNFAGNLGGIVSTLLIPVLIQHFGWFEALASGSLFALLAAAFWFFIRIANKEQVAGRVDEAEGELKV